MRIDSTRERRPTAGFGWVDHRIVRSGHLAALSQTAAAVYLVLCVVADRRGISYYSPPKLGELIKHSAGRVEAALSELAERGLVAREGRFMQVLALEPVARPPGSSQNGPGVDTPATDQTAGAGSLSVDSKTREPGSEPESPETILAALPVPERETLLELARQKLRSLTGSREPSRAIVLAVAAGLARQERGA